MTRHVPIPLLLVLLLGACAQQQLARSGADAVLWQHSSAEARLLFEQAYELAGMKLHAELRHMHKDTLAGLAERPLAVVVDVDETVLDNSPYQVWAIRHGRTFNERDWKAWTARAEAKALPGALEFLSYAASEGCEVFYITNRDQDEREATLKNLRDRGFPWADEEHLLLREGSSDKTARRKRVTDTHTVLLYVGDQLRDVDERFKDRSMDHGKGLVDTLSASVLGSFIMLPNPMYGTWRDAVQGKGDAATKRKRMKAWYKEHSY